MGIAADQHQQFCEASRQWRFFQGFPSLHTDREFQADEHAAVILPVSCAEWDSLNQPDRASVVLATPKAFSNNQTFWASSASRRTTALSVLLSIDVTFSPWTTLPLPIRLPVDLTECPPSPDQLALLTATLPPALAPKQANSLRQIKPLELFRAPTHWHSIIYRVWNPAADPAYLVNDAWFPVPAVIEHI
ncbi:hypothetical protein N7532_009718 [Penicillium argentinense]|uniref:Uncharacterized protein n=1 Tax=Penicillium argentinense TaxID=1131581 RepID=A0A9W9K2T4_9EURO|nr:uncharacterized protein N7532_009718 [Penicillium argentinense]KAJ5091034.1 hypothetical protein N7532_009718 [Penicillium argentinense]